MIYGQWRRVSARAELDSWELRQREEEEAWDLRNEILADRLDALLGTTVRLRAACPVGERRFPAHSRFRVLWRNKDRLILSWLKDDEILVVLEAERFDPEPPVKHMTAVDILDEWLLNRTAAGASEMSR